MRLEKSQSVYMYPHWLSRPVAWAGHIPFAFWIVEVLRPQRFVELGTYAGTSYFAFCQSISRNNANTDCCAVDTWMGDPHCGTYGIEVYEQVQKYNKNHYQRFSRLLRMTFDEALGEFEDSSIDLLHIDGCHTYGEVKHDFESWLPKMSRRGVILLHDIEVKDKGFGVWRLWEELRESYNGVEFPHCNGLGVLFVGREQSPELAEFQAEWKTEVGRRGIKSFFEALGGRISSDVALALKEAELADTSKALTELQRYVANTRASFSWRVATPVRVIENMIRLLRDRRKAPADD